MIPVVNVRVFLHLLLRLHVVGFLRKWLVKLLAKAPAMGGLLTYTY